MTEKDIMTLCEQIVLSVVTPDSYSFHMPIRCQSPLVEIVGSVASM
jgi:hypothetical protein